MARRALTTTAAALTATAALLLCACGGGDDAPSDDIKGADTASDTPSASAPASAASGVKRPAITLPSGSRLTFENWTSSDPDEQAVLDDGKEELRSGYAAIIANYPDSEALAFYHTEGRLSQAQQWIRSPVGREGLQGLRPRQGRLLQARCRPGPDRPRHLAVRPAHVLAGGGRDPDVPEAPTPEILAAYAYDKVKVPETEIELRPEARSTVNLPTWVWLDEGTFKDVTVRAELPHTGLWAETTAKPVALHLEPGTDDAETYPASGDCEITDDGSIGSPYTKGDADRTPPCGIRHLRATAGDPYRLTASITWQVPWEGSGGTGGDLPDGTFETTRDMTVQEIQSSNR
ncbi:hypothetical protein GCM10010294_45790 [Streptomyces griseoloalbus]|nr:hypothetical protein GCM10010294_45790 [Streptomyces griseoloalbus]